jgi:hypothetical protein
MVRIKAFWTAFKNFAILLSFIMNFILIVVLLVVIQQIFAIKGGILEPLVTGLHSSFVGLGEARIITNITVEDTIPVKLDIPLDTQTVVTLTDNVPLNVPAGFTLSDGTTLRGRVAITLPRDLQLPVALKLNVPVDSPLPIKLNVPVDIPLNQTQLNDVAERLEGLFDPLVRLIGNLPSDWNSAAVWVGRILSGDAPDLWAPNRYITDPWPGFRTGLVPPGADVVPVPDAGAAPIGEQTPVFPVDGAATPSMSGDPGAGGLPVGPTPTLSIPTLEAGAEPVEVQPTPSTPTAIPALPSATPEPTLAPTSTPSATPSATPTPTPEPAAAVPALSGSGESPTPVQDLGIITPTPSN